MNTGDMYTTLPGYVVDYDGETVTAVPAMDMQLTNGQVLKPPGIVQVPVFWLAGDNDQALISVPIKPGDDIVLHFSCRSIENWLSGNDQAPDDPRQFDLSDAFCTPVLRPGGRKADTENVSVEYGAGWMKIAPNGDITFQTPNLTANVENATTINSNTVEVNASKTTFNSPVTIHGPLVYTGGMTGSGGATAATINGDVVADGISLKHHQHPGDSGGTTGEPI